MSSNAYIRPLCNPNYPLHRLCLIPCHFMNDGYGIATGNHVLVARILVNNHDIHPATPQTNTGKPIAVPECNYPTRAAWPLPWTTAHPMGRDTDQSQLLLVLWMCVIFSPSLTALGPPEPAVIALAVDYSANALGPLCVYLIRQAQKFLDE